MSPNTIPRAASTSPPAAVRCCVGCVDCSGVPGSWGAGAAAFMAPFTRGPPAVARARSAVSAVRTPTARRDRSAGPGDTGDAVTGARGTPGGVDGGMGAPDRPVDGGDEEAAGDLAGHPEGGGGAPARLAGRVVEGAFPLAGARVEDRGAARGRVVGDVGGVVDAALPRAVDGRVEDHL